MYIVDTNVLYAFFHSRDSLHEKARALLERHSKDVVFIIPEVWEELISIFAVRFGSDKAIIIDETLKNGAFEALNHGVSQQEVWKKFFCLKTPHRMSYVDCILGYLIQEKKFKVLTFDKELQKYLKF